MIEIPKIPIIKNTILKFLEKNGEMTGYDLLKHCRENEISISPGSVYPQLKNMTRDGLIESKEQGRKKIYTLTESGKNEIETIRQESSDVLHTVGKLRLVINCDCDSVPGEFKYGMREMLESLGDMDWKDMDTLRCFLGKLECVRNSIKKYIDNSERSGETV